MLSNREYDRSVFTQQRPATIPSHAALFIRPQAHETLLGLLVWGSRIASPAALVLSCSTN